MKMSENQRRLVEENIGLVGKVMVDIVHFDGRQNIMDMDDLYQIGCLALCEAAMRSMPGSGRNNNDMMFSSYAYTVIRNKTLDALRYIGRRKKREGLYMEDAFGMEGPSGSLNRSSDLKMDVFLATRKASENARGVKKKGICVVLLTISGYKYTDIAKMYRVPDGHVRAWASMARKELRNDQRFISLKENM